MNYGEPVIVVLLYIFHSLLVASNVFFYFFRFCCFVALFFYDSRFFSLRRDKRKTIFNYQPIKKQNRAALIFFFVFLWNFPSSVFQIVIFCFHLLGRNSSEKQKTKKQKLALKLKTAKKQNKKKQLTNVGCWFFFLRSCFVFVFIISRCFQLVAVCSSIYSRPTKL